MSTRANDGAESTMITSSRSHSMKSLFQHESTSWPKNSTSYAGLASPTQQDIPMPPISPQSNTSYAAAAAAPASPRRASHPTTAPTQFVPTNNTKPAPRSAFPPLVVDCLPHWTRHFQALAGVLGHVPNARPFGRGVRFLPKSAEEFRIVQQYMTEAAAQDKTISWYCYSPATEVPTKVAIRGLPLETPTDEVVAALCALGYPAEAARAIPPARGMQSCTYYVRLAHLTQEELHNLYTTTELLLMPQVTIEAWRGGSKPPQCFRCQKYSHSSAHCFRPIRCVRCAGEHAVRDCSRPRDDPPTCANCGQSHAANDRRCSHYRREARRRGILQRPLPPRAHTQSHQQRLRTTTASLQPRASIVQTTSDARPHTTSAPVATAPATTTAPTTSLTDATRVYQTTRLVDPIATRRFTTLVADANPPIERGRPARGRRHRHNGAQRAPSEPAAASTPHPRQTKATTAPFLAQETVIVEENSGPTQTQAAQKIFSAKGQALASIVARLTTAAQSTPPNAQAPPRPPPAHQLAHGEAQTNPDVMAIVRVVVEALMTGLTAYLQGQGALPALAAGMAVLTRLHSC